MWTEGANPAFQRSKRRVHGSKRLLRHKFRLGPRPPEGQNQPNELAKQANAADLGLKTRNEPHISEFKLSKPKSVVTTHIPPPIEELIWALNSYLNQNL